MAHFSNYRFPEVGLVPRERRKTLGRDVVPETSSCTVTAVTAKGRLTRIAHLKAIGQKETLNISQSRTTHRRAHQTLDVKGRPTLYGTDINHSSAY